VIERLTVGPDDEDRNEAEVPLIGIRPE